MQYLWFRVRVIVLAHNFIRMMTTTIQNSDKAELEKQSLMMKEDFEKSKRKAASSSSKTFRLIENIWIISISLSLWFNLVTTPAIMIFPSLKDDLSYLLWLNETCWILDIAHKLLMRKVPGKDPYDVAVSYIKSTLILDLIATFP